MIGKQTPWRNPKYLKWVKSQNCIVTLRPADDPHHIIGHGFGGTGTKAPDWAVIPLTREMHNGLHGPAGIMSWEYNYGNQMDLLARFWRENWDEIQEFFK